MQIVLINNQPLMLKAESLLLHDVLSKDFSIRTESSLQEYFANCNANRNGTAKCGELIIYGLNEITPAAADELEALVQFSKEQPVLVLATSAHHAATALAYKSGAKGCVLASSQPSALKHIISLVQSGEEFFPATTSAQPFARSFNELPPLPAQHQVIAQLQDQSQAVPLTARQIDVLKLLSQGQSNKQIARSLGIYEGTVKAHLRMIAQKMGTHNRTELALLTTRLNIIDAGPAETTEPLHVEAHLETPVRGPNLLRAIG